MARDLKNKTVVITGGAQGIGYSISEKYLEKGAKVVILVDIDDKQGPASAQALNSKYGSNKAEFFQCDVSSDLDSTANKIMNKYKTVDVLVNNAGVLNEYDIQKTIGINVTALMEWSVKFFEHMRKDNGGKGGTIINLASISGYRVQQYLPIYQGSKFAVIGFTRSFGHRYRYERYGVRVVVLCPGFTETVMTTNENMKMNDEKIQDDFEEFLRGNLWQQVDSVGNAAAEVFERADSGSAWLIEGSKPIVEVPYQPFFLN